MHIDCKSGYRTQGPEVLRPVGETELMARFAREAAAEPANRIRACAGIVGYADLTLGARVQDVLRAHLAAGGGLFRGIRVRAAWHPDPAFQGPADGPPSDLLQLPAFREGFAQLAPLGLTCDLWVYHTQLGDAAGLAAAYPETPIVLNHVGGPLGIGPYAGKRDAVFTEWKAGVRALARHENMHVKLGGLAMPRIGFAFDEREVPPSSAELAAAWQPYIDTCLDSFGPQRCMFESNFPVDKGMTGYRVLWNAYKRMASSLAPAEQDAVFHQTAARFYAIDG
ncbi:MAG TPA: amidohydrolase family protein [Acetobacteraceae bacterium]|nr:amidohydrolase family protein [Acetobacteraceae bacterium]